MTPARWTATAGLMMITASPWATTTPTSGYVRCGGCNQIVTRRGENTTSANILPSKDHPHHTVVLPTARKQVRTDTAIRASGLRRASRDQARRSERIVPLRIPTDTRLDETPSIPPKEKPPSASRTLFSGFSIQTWGNFANRCARRPRRGPSYPHNVFRRRDNRDQVRLHDKTRILGSQRPHRSVALGQVQRDPAVRQAG